MVLIVGFKGHSLNSDCAVVYCGNSGAEAEAAVAKLKADCGFIRIGRLVNPMMIPVRLPECLLTPPPSEASNSAPPEEPPPISKLQKKK